MLLQFQVNAFHVEEAGGQAPEDDLHEDEGQGAPTFRMEDGLEQRLRGIHLKSSFFFWVISHETGCFRGNSGG